MATKKPRKETASTELRSLESEMNLSPESQGELPWWLPENLEIKTKELSAIIMKDAYDNGYFEVAQLDTKMSIKQKRKFAENVFFSCVKSSAWREEFAKWCMLKPFEAAKLMRDLMPKQVKIEGDITHNHAIIVPGTVSPDEWNKTHEARKVLESGDWGTDLVDTPFAPATIEVDDAPI